MAFRDGKVPLKIDSRDEPCETYYKIYGDYLKSTPLIVLHGGPGSGHEYVEPFSDLWTRYQIPVILYDQIGCARSTHLPETRGDKSFWQPGIFVAELDNLIRCLGLLDTGNGYHVLGHSWGGSLAVEFATRQPPGLQRLILVGANAAFPYLRKNLWDLLERLSVEDQNTIKDAVEKGDFSGKPYMDAMGTFLSTFLCRGRPFPPPELAADMANHAADPTVRETMLGQCPFVLDGSVGEWDGTSLLSSINAPTFVFNGEYDTAQYRSNAPFFEHIPKARWVTLAGASHMSHLDSPEMRDKTTRLFGQFLLPEREIDPTI